MYSQALNNLDRRCSLVLMLNYPFLNAIVKEDSLLTAALKDEGLATRLGIITPIFTESFYFARADSFGAKLLTIIYSSLVILLGLNSDYKH